MDSSLKPLIYLILEYSFLSPLHSSPAVHENYILSFHERNGLITLHIIFLYSSFKLDKISLLQKSITHTMNQAFCALRVGICLVIHASCRLWQYRHPGYRSLSKLHDHQKWYPQKLLYACNSHRYLCSYTYHLGRCRRTLRYIHLYCSLHTGPQCFLFSCFNGIYLLRRIFPIIFTICCLLNNRYIK